MPNTLLLEMTTCALDGELAVVEQMLDRKNRLHVFPPVKALVRLGLLRSDERELGLPVSQHVLFDTNDVFDFANFKEEFIR